ncbi:MAG: signal peptide protein, partial [Steroidobacterales bacterium]
MNASKLNGLICGAFLSAALLAAPAISLAQDASAAAPVCKDGTTAAKAGRGACRGHGGVNKSAGASTAAPAAGAAAAAAPAAAATSSSSSAGPVTCKDGSTSEKGG